MPIVDRREFGGRFTVKENSQRLANYRYLEIQLMEMLGGWSHTTPQLAFKATFGYHVYDHAQAADLLGERLEQLRSGRDEPGAGDRRVRPALRARLELLDDTIDRLVAVYRVLEPHLVSTYVYHADATDPLIDAPTVRLLRQLAAMGQSHVAWGKAVLEGLTTDRPTDRRRAIEVQADLEARLVECGGVTGQGIESHWLTFHSAKEEAEEPSGGPSAAGAATSSASVCAPLDHPVVEEPFWFSEQPGRLRRSTRPRTSGRWRASGTSSTSCSTARWRRPTAWARCWPSSPTCPGSMRMELAHQMWDEARHIEIVAKAVRGRTRRRDRLRPLDAALVVDAERPRPAAAA